MRVRLRNPDREVERSGARSVWDVPQELQIDPGLLLIRGRTLLACGDPVREADELEIGPVVSGESSP